MTRVCLIPLLPARDTSPPDRLASFRDHLEAAGYPVVIEGSVETARETMTPARPANDQMGSAAGSVLVLVNLAMAYKPDDILAVVRRLEAGDATMVVAARRGRRLGSFVRRIAETSDLGSGLIGLTQAAARRVAALPIAGDSRLALELLARVDGPHAEVEIAAIPTPTRPWTPLDDIRFAKRIADRRFGNVSRLFQFCFVGASGMVVDLSTYAALQAILGRTWLGGKTLFRSVAGGSSTSLAVASAAVLAIVTAMTWNFWLNRRLTFSYARQGSIGRQYVRYALSNLVGCGVSLAFRLLLPGSIPFFARHRLAAAVAGIVAATGISFTLARWFVFGVRTAAAVVAVDDPAAPIARPSSPNAA